MRIALPKTGRIHSLDSLRAIMMLLGLVIHSALTYSEINYGDSWNIKDPYSTHLFFDLIVVYIHTFRMPVFFLVAGFFGAMLFYERQPFKMIKNRASRIVLPFIVFLILLRPLIIFTFSYTWHVFNGSATAFETTLSYFSNPLVFIPDATSHLWFLYSLIQITTATVVSALLLKKLPVLTNRITLLFNRIIQKSIIRILFFAGLTSLVYLYLGTSEVHNPWSFIPELKSFVFYLMFYLVGWVLFKSKQHLKTMVRYDWIFIIIGIIAVSLKVFLVLKLNLGINSDFWYLMVLNSVAVWAFIFGITGIFIRYGSEYSKRMRYISDASYWVYLIHFPLTAYIPSLIMNWPLPAIAKFLIVLISTAVICFTTYHYFVRATIIGKFLNGRKYSRKISDIKQVEELSQIETILVK